MVKAEGIKIQGWKSKLVKIYYPFRADQLLPKNAILKTDPQGRYCPFKIGLYIDKVYSDIAHENCLSLKLP